MVLQVKDADGQGEFWDGVDGTRWGTRGLRQRQLLPPPCPSLLCVPPPGPVPLAQRRPVQAPHPPANHSQLGWGCSRGTELGQPPSSYRVGSMGDSHWEAGWTPLRPLSSSCPLPPLPIHHGMGNEVALTPLLTYSILSTKPKTHGDREHLLRLELWFRHQSLLCGTESK